MTISFSSQISIPPDVLIRELDGEAVLLNLNSERYFGLDEVGTRMWAVLAETSSIQAAYDTLLTEYDVEGDRLRQDLQNLLEQLVQHGLVEVK